MRSLFYLGLLALMMSCGGAKKLASPQFPVIVFEDDNINLGELAEGKTATILYKFSNQGKAPLNIEIVTACKCTSIEWTRGDIPPGGKGEIYVTFDSQGMEGQIEKTVDIVSNVEAIVTEIFFTANILKE